jgi:hypothetical protein
MKKVFTLIIALFIGVVVANATDYIWNFSSWTATSGYTANYTAVQDLMIFNPSLATNMCAINTNSKTIGGVSYTQRCQLNGGGYSSTVGFNALPTQRFIAINVTGPSTISVAFITGSSSSTRTCYITDGTNTIASAADSNTGTLVTGNYTGGAGKIYIFSDAAINLYMISATNVDSANPIYAASSISNQTVARGGILSNIVFATPCSDATVTGLPTGLNGTYLSGAFTISGTVDPAANTGDYAYTVTSTTYNATATGTISVDFGTGITTSQTNTLSIRSVPGAILISQPADVEILNVTGKEVMSATQSASVSTVSLPKGVYIVRAQASNSNAVQKVIVQ